VFGILLTLLILDGILMMVVILLQAGKGGGLAAVGGGAGTDTFMGGRQATTILTKATWVTGGLFLALAVVLAILSSRSQDQTPLLQEEFQSAPTAPQPILPGAGEAPVEEGGAVPGVTPEGEGAGGGEGGTDPGQ
jgi:preprotein translocase subunit SecG